MFKPIDFVNYSQNIIIGASIFATHTIYCIANLKLKN